MESHVSHGGTPISKSWFNIGLMVVPKKCGNSQQKAMVSIRDGSWENRLQMEDFPATFDDTGEYIPTVVKLSGTMGI